MGFWSLYDPRTGIVFDEIDDAIEAALKGAGGGGGVPPKPGPSGAANPPAGSKIQGNGAIDTNGYTWHLGPGGWEQGYMASAAAQKQAGVGPSSGASGSGYTSGATTNYAAQNAAQKGALQTQQGALQSQPPNSYLIAPTRAVDRSGLTVWTKDPVTGNFVNSGFPPNNADKQAAARIAYQERSGGTTTPTTPTTPQSPLSGPVAPTAPGLVANPLEGNRAPSLSAFSSFATPNAQVSADGLKTMYTGPEMNTLINSRAQSNGPSIPYGVAGIKPPGSGNNYNFGGAERGGAPSPGTIGANAQFPSTAFSVPQGYERGPSGFTLPDNGGSFKAFDMPVNVSGPSATSPGGAGVATLQGPQNLTLSNPDKSVGYGLTVNSPFAYNSIGATYGRELGGPNRDAATGAMEALMLANAQQKYGPEAAMAILTRPDAGYFTGQPGLYGNQPMEGNGVRTDYGWIFGGSDMGDYSPDQRFAGGGQVQANPWAPWQNQYLDPWSKRAAAISLLRGDLASAAAYQGLDISDFNHRPNHFPMPLNGVQSGAVGGFGSFSTGGRVASGPLAPGTSPHFMVTPEQMFLVGKSGKVYGTMGEDNADPGRAPNPELLRLSGPANSTLDITPLTRTRFDTGGTVTAPLAPGTNPTIASATGGTGNGEFNALDPALLAPWQQAAQKLANEAGNRSRYGYRNEAAGIGKATGIPVMSGNAPSTQLAPNTFYDLAPAVNAGLSNLLGLQTDLTTLGNVDENSGNILTQIAQLQQQQAPYQQGMNLQTQITGYGQVGDPATLLAQINALDAGAGVFKQINALNGELSQLGQPWSDADMQSQQDNIANMEYQLANGYGVDPAQLDAAKNHLAQMFAHNNKWLATLAARDNLRISAGYANQAEMDAALAQYQAQLAGVQQQYDNAQKVAQLKNQLNSLVGEGVDPTLKYGEIGALIQPLQQQNQGIASRNQKRLDLRNSVKNLAALGVPKLSGPVLT